MVTEAKAIAEDGGLPWMRGVFYGVGAAVIAVIARSAYKLARTTVGLVIAAAGLVGLAWSRGAL